MKDNKGNKQWVWLALDADTREIVGVYIRARDESAARKLWHSLPPVYPRVFARVASPRNTRCQCAIASTDFWAAYALVLPSKRHRAVSKETGKTSYVDPGEKGRNIVKFNKQAIGKREFFKGLIVPSMSPVRIPVKPGLEFENLVEVRIVPQTATYVI